MSHVRCVCSSHMSLPGPSRAIGLALPLVRADRRDCGRVPRASRCCRCRRTTVMLSRPACVDRGISCVGPVGRGRRASACVEGPVRGRGPRSTDETPDARFGVAPRGLRTIAVSPPAVSAPGRASVRRRRRPGVPAATGATRTRTAAPAVLWCWRDVGVRNASPLDVSTSPGHHLRDGPRFESVNCLGGDVGPERHPPPRWPGPRFRSWS